MIDEIRDVVSFLEKRLPEKPEVAIILGSGLGAFADHLERRQIIPYNEIPHFQTTTVEGHEGRIVFGYVKNVPVAALQGRWHFYEGHSMHSIALPTRAMGSLGAHTLILTNAAGGVNLDFRGGELMLIKDHLNLMGDNPLTGKESTQIGPRFPDMSEPYCRESISLIEQAAAKLGINVKKGVYVGLRGPTYETPAEVRMLRTLGGDAVGMSTVPEVIVANNIGLPCVALSIITDLGVKGKIVEISHEEVQEIAKNSEPIMTFLIKELLATIYNLRLEIKN